MGYSGTIISSGHHTGLSSTTRVMKAKDIRWVEYVAHMGHEKFLQDVVRKRQGLRPRHRWEYNIRMHLR